MRQKMMPMRAMLAGLFVACALATILLPAVASAGSASVFSSGKVSFVVKVRGETTSYRELAVSVLPEVVLSMEVTGGRRGARFEASASDSSLIVKGPRKWEWKTPAAAGLHPLTIRGILQTLQQLFTSPLMRPGGNDATEIVVPACIGIDIGLYIDAALACALE